MYPLPKTRREAFALHVGQYFTGKPCLYGHTAYRYASSGACSDCIKGNVQDARRAYEPPQDLVAVKLRAHPADAATLLDSVVAVTQQRHPAVTREQILGKKAGEKPEGGTLLYHVNTDPVDVQLFRDMQNAMLAARGPNIQALRAAAFGGNMAQAEAARDNGEGEWNFT